MVIWLFNTCVRQTEKKLLNIPYAILSGSKKATNVLYTIGGFPMEIHTKIRYLIICGYQFFPYKIMIATNYEVSYFSKFDRISAYSFQNKSIATTRWVARQGLSHGLPNPIKAGLGFKLVFATIA